MLNELMWNVICDTLNLKKLCLSINDDIFD